VSWLTEYPNVKGIKAKMALAASSFEFFSLLFSRNHARTVGSLLRRPTDEIPGLKFQVLARFMQTGSCAIPPALPGK
jgi:hypothetical protein